MGVHGYMCVRVEVNDRKWSGDPLASAEDGGWSPFLLVRTC